jgi:penicillin-insensitive murein endopeptidase
MGRVWIPVLVLSTISFLYAKESICYGTTAKGRLENGVRLPNLGQNYIIYSAAAGLLGRTYVHSKVKEVLLASYRSLETLMPDKVYKYAETGFEEGGKFSPHKTHQNGLSVDFMVPVVNQEGDSLHLPTHAFNRFGYDIEFDKRGHYDTYSIDYEAMAAHIYTLHQEAQKRGVRIWRVIFDPKLQPYLFKTKYGSYLKKHIAFSKRRSWVRHDEHYHIDFIVKCRKL